MRKNRAFLGILGFCLLLGRDLVAVGNSPLSFTDFNGKVTEVRWDAPQKKGTVIIFLSAICPCSQSHEKKIASLIARYPQFQFIGVHSNNEEELAYVKEHFKKSSIPFLSMANDRDQKLANRFGALKTPHAFVLDREGNPRYRGGVDNSHNADKADLDYLKDALDAVDKGIPVKMAETKPLGCVISR